jgi:hypothetical protein
MKYGHARVMEMAPLLSTQTIRRHFGLSDLHRQIE